MLTNTKTSPSPDRSFAEVELHRIQCLLRLAEFKAELRRDAMAVRRTLADELDALDRREGEQ